MCRRGILTHLTLWRRGKLNIGVQKLEDFYQKKYYPDILVTSMRKSTAENGRMGMICVHVAIKM